MPAGSGRWASPAVWLLLGSPCSLLHTSSWEAEWRRLAQGITAALGLRLLKWCHGTSPGPKFQVPSQDGPCTGMKSSPQEDHHPQGSLPSRLRAPQAMLCSGLAGSLCPRQREGGLGRAGCDSFLSTQPSAKQEAVSRGQSAATKPQLKPCSGWPAAASREATEQWSWQDPRPCPSGHHQHLP